MINKTKNEEINRSNIDSRISVDSILKGQTHKTREAVYNVFLNLNRDSSKFIRIRDERYNLLEARLPILLLPLIFGLLAFLSGFPLFFNSFQHFWRQPGCRPMIYCTTISTGIFVLSLFPSIPIYMQYRRYLNEEMDREKIITFLQHYKDTLAKDIRKAQDFLTENDGDVSPDLKSQLKKLLVRLQTRHDILDVKEAPSSQLC